MGWRTKSIAQVQTEFDRGELKRTLGPIHLVLFGIGCIIGAGIFVRTGTAAALYAGPAVMLSFVIAGVVCAFAGLCYAELASMLPVSGSAYTYAYTTVGEFGAWIMGALLLLEYALAASVVAVGWSGYAVSLLHDIGLNIPAALTQAVGKLVVCAASTFSMTDPLVSLNGVTAHAHRRVGGAVPLAGQGDDRPAHFTAALAQYDVVDAAKAGGYALINSLDIAVNADSQALLTAATKVLDPATARPARARGGHAVVDVPRGSIVQLPLSAVVPMRCRVGRDLAVQPAGGVHHAGGDHAAGASACPSPRTVNNIIVAIKVTVILAVHRGGRVLREPRQLASVHSRTHGRRESIRHRRRDSRRDDRVLRLHRLRGGVDRRPGSEESAQGHAHRHPGFADHLHRALHG